MPITTEVQGIFQSDIILRSAIISAIRDLRANTYLLPYVFASLPKDTLTAKEYGEQELARAVEWFTKTEIHVFFNVNPESVQFPCITMTLASSAEQDSEGTLGDVHYIPREDNDYNWPVLAGPLTPVSYDKTTGTVVFDPIQLNGLVLANNMLLVDKNGNEFTILATIDSVTVKIAANTVSNFEQSVIRPSRPAYVTQLESTVYREVYAIGCHVSSEPVHLTYLHSILMFILLRYKQSLLEARGFERSVVSSSDFKRDEQQPFTEWVFSRYCQVTGAVRQSWPKITAQKVTGFEMKAVASQALPPQPNVDPDSDEAVFALFDEIDLI